LLGAIASYLLSVSSAVEGAGGGPRLNCGRTPDRKSRQGRPKIAHGFNPGSRVERAQSPEGVKEKMRLERPVLSSLTGLDSYSRPNPAMNRLAYSRTSLRDVDSRHAKHVRTPTSARETRAPQT